MRDKNWGKFLVEFPFVKEIVNGRDLRFIDLNKDNLSGADLRGSDLSGAYLWGANQAFSKIENEFEEIENQINRSALELDKAIQLEIDAANGK